MVVENVCVLQLLLISISVQDFSLYKMQIRIRGCTDCHLKCMTMCAGILDNNTVDIFILNEIIA